MAERPLCNCGWPASLKQVTDATKESYSRWFWGCKQFNVDRSSCGFFAWYRGAAPQPGSVNADLQRAIDGSYKCLLCGQACVFGDNEHICRLYGLYQCDCGRTWSSGYTWTGTTQQCKFCKVSQRPNSCQQLQRGPGARAGSGLPHDSAHCSMCQHLGRPCCQTVRQGQPTCAMWQD